MVDIRGGQAISRTISAFAQRRSGWKSKKVKIVSKETSPKKKKLEMVAIELLSQYGDSLDSDSDSKMETSTIR